MNKKNFKIKDENKKSNIEYQNVHVKQDHTIILN